ncbi:SusD/RagB family nutrient-binding outer membrane lipoprotein [Neptunitalea lumnitzerae]|uniref:Starch-binding associating with outer membrane n=1 Tax=Neptunitalea lumnitzerae TaxID=2965509 RepID=A0ABQ5MLM1_9FLAO|nr:SusD/RagB family nutrient-binding outer membrane lipoprotein [Neptunitalea sp. Y10]GLB50297.1 hypothetical protein Y10_26650 [Neptunitalea sp. Y10]
MKHTISKLFFLATAIVMVGCTNDFEDINTNKQNPTEAAPNLLLTGVIRSSATTTAALGAEEGLVVTQHAAKVQSTNDDIYNWDPNDQPYSRGYNALRDIYNMIDASKDSQGFSGYYGIALILKSWTYSVMTDAYGDLPYTEAIMGRESGDFFPEFSSQQVIYQGILADLEEANTVLAAAPSNIEGDILYGGDILKWQKFANSLRLRLLMRLADVDNATAVAGIQQIVNNPSTYPIFDSNDDNAALQHEVQNPSLGYDTREGSFNVWRLSVTMETRLKALNDWRIAAFFQPTTDSGQGIFSSDINDYVGVPNGLGDEASESYSPTGDPSMSGSNYISKLGVLYACSECTSESSYDAAQSIFMTYSEVAFLLAEARAVGYISVGSAETYYQNGIIASVEYYKDRVQVGGWTGIYNALDSMDMNIYLNQTGVAFTGNAQDDLAKIYEQKWIALFQTGLEAWSDWRRTSMPEVIPGPAARNDGEVPVRFLYPNSVKSLNSDNYEAAVENMGGDTLKTRLWWDTADND